HSGILANLADPTATLFPYTTLFRSPGAPSDARWPARAETTPRAPTVSVNGCVVATAVRTEISGAVFSAVASPESLRHPKSNEPRSEEHTSELQSRSDLVCRLLLEKK